MSIHYEDLFMNKKRQKLFKSYANTNFKKKDKLGVKIIKNGIILPAEYDKKDEFGLRILGGVVDGRGKFVEESKSQSFGGYYRYDKNDLKKCDEEVIYFGAFIKHWGHFLVDQISRLWYVTKNPSKYKIAYCGWNWKKDHGNFDGNFLELITLLGIKEEQLMNIQEPMQFKKVIIPELSFLTKQYYSDEFEKMIDKIVSNVKGDYGKCPEKVYFTRTELSGNIRDFGENKIVAYLKDLGYEIMAPEKLTFSEQVYYMNNVKEFCTTVGTTSHNIMFARNNNKIILLNKFKPVNGYQITIDQMLKAKITYVDVYKYGFPAGFGMGPFLMNVNKYLRRAMKGRYNRRYRISYKDKKDYLKKYYEIYKEPGNRRRMENDKTGM